MSEKAKQAAAADESFDYMEGMMNAAPKQHKCETYLRLPAGITLFNGKEDVCYRLIFFPWKAGKGNPAAINGPGSPVINRFLHVHQNIGADNEWHLCPHKTMGQPCVVCQTKAEIYAASKGKRLSKEEYSKQITPLNAKEREFWLVHELDGKPNNLQVWEESIHLFGNYLRKWTSSRPQFKPFANPNTGFVVEVTGTEKQIGTGTCVDWGSMIQFVQRTDEETALVKKLFAKVSTMCPDNWVIGTSNDRLKKVFLMLGDQEEEETTETPADEFGIEPATEEETVEEAPAPAPKPKPEVASAPKPKPKPAPVPEPEAEEEELEEEAPAPAPKPKPKPAAAAPKPKPAPAPEPETEEEEAAEEAPAPKPKPKPAAAAAPKPKPKPAPEPEEESESEDASEENEEEEVEEES